MAEETQIDRTDRRSTLRETIERRVVFSGVRGEGLLRQGTAMDISASGLLIHTAQPDLVGRHLEVELHGGNAVTPGNVIMVRAEVAWVKPLPERGQYAMGVRFLQSAPATDVTGASYRPAGREEATRLAESIRRTLDIAEPGVRLELSDAALVRSRSSNPGPAATGPTKQSRRSRLLLWLLLLLLFAALVFLLTVGLLWRLESFKKRAAAPPSSAASAPADLSPGMPQENPDPTGVPESFVGDDSGVVAERLDQIQDGGPAYNISRGSHWLAQGRFPAAVQAFHAVQSQPDATPVERYIAQLGEAEALARNGEVPAALALLESPFEGLDLVPSTWRSLKAQFRDGLLATPGQARARAPMINAFTFAPAAAGAIGAGENAEDASAAGDANGVRIEIDTTRYLLNVLENNAIQAVYPVGLGARDLTPEGLYTIVNKIEDPDWYNNGDVVPAGDPDNQLGSRWLGLADDNGPTQLGIHATNDLESIGDKRSRGCIRMRPADIVALFERIPVGTPVRVKAL